MKAVGWMRADLITRQAARWTNMIGPCRSTQKRPFFNRCIGGAWFWEIVFEVRMFAQHGVDCMALGIRELDPGDAGNCLMPGVVPCEERGSEVRV